MAYEKQTFSPNEVLTAAKMNKMSDNLEALRDGSAIKAGSIEPGKLSSDVGLYYAENTSQNAPSNGVDSDLASSGAKVTLNLSKPCKAMITVVIGIKSDSDFEFKPIIFRNGTALKKLNLGASIGSASGRRFQRTIQGVFDLSAGSNVLSAGVQIVSATNQLITAGDAWISVVILK